MLSNTVWAKLTEEEFKDLEESRHEDFDDQVWKMRFGSATSETNPAKIREQPPLQPKVKTYKLTFGKNKNLAITENYKMVSAHSHNKAKRVTLIY